MAAVPEQPAMFPNLQTVVLLFLHFAVLGVAVCFVMVILGMAGALQCSWWMLLIDQMMGSEVPVILQLISPILVRP